MNPLVLLAQVDEGDTEIITIRDTNSELGSLVTALVVLGVVTLIATAIFWWLTRPRDPGELNG